MTSKLIDSRSPHTVVHNLETPMNTRTQSVPQAEGTLLTLADLLAMNLPLDTPIAIPTHYGLHTFVTKAEVAPVTNDTSVDPVDAVTLS